MFFSASKSQVSFNSLFSSVLLCAVLGRVVRKPVNANPGLKVNRSNIFSCKKVLSIAYVLCTLRLLALKTEGQKI